MAGPGGRITIFIHVLIWSPSGNKQLLGCFEKKSLPWVLVNWIISPFFAQRIHEMNNKRFYFYYFFFQTLTGLDEGSLC